MAKLIYEPKSKCEKSYEETYLTPLYFETASFYNNKGIMNEFLKLKTNLVDFDHPRILRIVTGTEQDFIMLLNRAEARLKEQNVSPASIAIILKLFKECVFGYYVLTPLIEDKNISDIDVDAWDHITIKRKGVRYITNVTFPSKDDYEQWYKRLMEIHYRKDNEENSLQNFSDLKGAEDYTLRIDLTLNYATKSNTNRLHIRKFPKEKPSWEELYDDGMLNKDIFEYIRDRISAGYSFLLSGESGSGKSVLLNKMLDLIPYTRKVLVTQESDELYSNTHPYMIFEHEIKAKNKSQIDPVTLEDELRQGLLQDINAIVVGEIKGAEALHVCITAVNTGAVFFGTLHSHDCESSVGRLVHCAKLGSDYSVEDLQEMIAGVPMTLIHMSYYSVDEIAEVTGWDNEKKKLIISPVFKKELINHERK